MRGWLFVAALIILLAAVLAFTEQQPWAMVTVIFGNERFSTNFAFLMLALIGVLIFIRLLGVLFNLPVRLMQASRKRRAVRLREEFDQGILLYLQGRHEPAHRCFLKASQEQSLAYTARLLAASCALARGNFPEVREALQAAQAADIKGDFGVRLIQSEMLLESGQSAQALAHLDKLRRQQPDNRKLVELLVQACEATDRWELLASALPKLRKLYSHEPDKLHAIETSVARKLLQLSAERMSENELLEQWRNTSRSIRPELLVAYARLLADVGAVHTAERVLCEAIEANWAQDCIVCYGDLEGGDVERRTKRVERWLQGRPTDPVLLLGLGRLYSRAGLWGQAARCLKKSLSLSPGLQTGEELGRVLRHLGEDKL